MASSFVYCKLDSANLSLNFNFMKIIKYCYFIINIMIISLIFRNFIIDFMIVCYNYKDLKQQKIINS